MVEFIDVSKRFKKVAALQNVSFTASGDEITGIIGHNGAGKTTLFIIANGLMKPTGGDVIIDGVSLRDNIKGIQALTSLYTDRMYLYPMLTVKECLSFFIGVYKAPKSRYEYLIETFQLSSHVNKMFSALSTGLQKRLKLAVSVVNEPKVLFLDEPFSGLDPEARYSLIQLIKRIKSDKIQILISSHDLLELETIVSKIIVLKNGGVIADGYMDGLIDEYFPEKYFNAEIYSEDINALLNHLNAAGITMKNDIEGRTNDIYRISLSPEDYILFENMKLPNTKILYANSHKPSLDELYLKINRSFTGKE